MKITYLERKQILTVHRRAEYAYVQRPDSNFILLRKDLPDELEELWDFNNFAICFNFWSDESLAKYRNGDWNNEFTKLTATQFMDRDLQNLYRGHPIEDGFIYRADGTPLNRKIQCYFWESYYNSPDKLIAELQKHKEWSDIEMVDVPHYNQEISGSHSINANYLPTQEQLNGWATSGELIDIGGSHGKIHDLPYIKKFLRLDSR